MAAHSAGMKMKKMVDAFASGDVNTATKLHRELFPLFRAMFVTTNPIPVKAALNMLGWHMGLPRLPLVEANTNEKELIKEVLLQTRVLNE